MTPMIVEIVLIVLRVADKLTTKWHRKAKKRLSKHRRHRGRR